MKYIAHLTERIEEIDNEITALWKKYDDSYYESYYTAKIQSCMIIKEILESKLDELITLKEEKNEI